MDDLIRRHILPSLNNEVLTEMGDSARLDLPSGSLCFTTDSYVVKPLFFSGGDIGKLAVCGTINDLAVAGSRPVALTLSLIIEDGFEIEMLDKILASIGQTARQNNVEIVAGDTKTVETGAADKIFINTAGIGVRLPGVDLGFKKIAAGDKIIINGSIGDHGMTILSQREDIKFQTQLKSDCAALATLTCKLLESVGGIKFMRDPTRGGLAATLNEISGSTGLSIEIREMDIPIKPTVQAAADMLGFDVLTIANEGKFVAVVCPEAAEKCLDICRHDPLGKEARIIGKVVETRDVPLVEIETRIGGRRIVQMPYGRELPRIC
ncbi:MAG: hydrogenase expression/formation protein HypE [Planctomycetes bacterium RBG_16_55_9]|nr:MAG: hydrogenase expression/formation protein HypE [Planctomycetes bacterium RBG_16_55_9]